MNVVSHIRVDGVTASSKTRLLMRGGQLAVADVQGLLILQQQAGTGQATVLQLLPEKYLKGKEVADFVEYERDQFLVSCLRDTHFYLINRQERKTSTIRSLNPGYITLGLQMMPNYERRYALVRDTRGIQLLDLLGMTSHQVFLTPCQTEFSDLRFLQVLFDEESQRYSVIALHKDGGTDGPVPHAEIFSPPQLCLFSFLAEFTQGVRAMFENTNHGRIALS